MLKTLDEVSEGGKERDNPRPPTYTPCILEASFKPRGLSSVTFRQECHLSLRLCNLAWNFPSRAPATPASQPLCLKDPGDGGQGGSRVEACLPPSSALPTAADLGCRMFMDHRWPTDIYVLGHIGFWKPLNSLLRLNNVSPKKKRCWFRFFPNVGKSDNKGPALLSWYHLLKRLTVLQLFKHFICINWFNPHNNVIENDYYYPHFIGVKTEA